MASPPRDTKQPPQWAMLITHLTHEDPEQLMANPWNWRIHEVHQQEAMTAALEEIGWAGAVIVNDTTGNVLDGHMRVELAMKHGATQVPVLHLQATEEQERLILATFDPIGALAVADREKLKELGGLVKPESDALTTMLQDLAIRYRDGQVSEAFRQFMEERSGGGTGDGEDSDDGEEEEEEADDGLDDEEDDGETYFPVTYSVTAAQRATILKAIKRAKDSAPDAPTSAAALTEVCRSYLED